MSKLTHGIRSVKIENFRCIDKLELDFTDPQGDPSDIIVIGGPNGSGKTAVLEACYSLVQGWNPKIPEGDSEAAARRLGIESVRKGTRHFAISLSLATPNQTVELSYENVFPFEAFRLPAIPNDLKVSAFYISSRRVQELVGSLSVSLGSKDNNENANPILNSLENQRLHSIKQTLLDTKTFESMGGVINSNFLQYDQIIAPLNEMWSAFYPNSKQSFSTEPVSKNPNRGFDVFLVDRVGSRVPIDLLSAGQLELFTLFGTLILLRHDPAIIFIDEPELHLDPQWHSILLGELRRFLPQAQFIVATHSPQIYDSVYTYQRHFLVPENDPRAQMWKATEKVLVSA